MAIKQLDYSKIDQRARGLDISPYTLAKRELNFREAKPGEKGNCWICKYRYPLYTSGKMHQSCEMIGVSNTYSDIDSKHTCDNCTICKEREAKC